MSTVKITIQNLIEQSIKELVPDADMSQGTALKDLLIEPNSLFLEKTFELIEASSDLLRVDKNAEDIDSLDSFAKNWFVDRLVGDKSVGYVRLYLTKASAIYFSPFDITIEKGGVIFENAEMFSATLSQVNKNKKDDLFYIETVFVSQQVGINNILQGESFSVVNNPFSFGKAEALSDFYPGTEIENNDEFIARIKKTISLRNLVNPKSIENLMIENFGWVKKVLTIGYGDVEMERDTIDLEEIAILLGIDPNSFELPDLQNFHIGNKVDIYCNYQGLFYDNVVLTSEQTNFYNKYGDYNYELDLSTITDQEGRQLFKFPIHQIIGIQVLDENYDPISLIDDISEEQVDCSNPSGFTNGLFSWSSLDKLVRFSPKEKIGLRLKSDLDSSGVPILDKTQLQGLNIGIIYNYFSGFKDIQDYMDKGEMRLVCADPLVKTFLPATVEVVDPDFPDDLTKIGKLKVKLVDGIIAEDVEFFISEYLRKLISEINISEFISRLICEQLITYIEQPILLRVKIPRLDRHIGFDGGTTHIDDQVFSYDFNEHEDTKKFLSSFDLEDLGEKGAGFVSLVEVEVL